MPLMQRNDTQGVIPRGSQCLIPSYRFDCSGNITEWLVSITSSSTVELIEIELQVWRPVNNTGFCFNKVGGNIFTVSTMVQVANFTPVEQIKFQPGDVVGFRLLPNPSQVQSPVTENSRNGDRNQDQDKDDEDDQDENEKNGDGEEEEDDNDDDDDGVIILNEVNNETPNEEVWFSRIGDTMTTLERDPDFTGCALSIGSNGMLTTFTNAAPLISASVLVIEENLELPAQGVTLTTSAPHAPVTAEEGTEGVLILVSATTVPAIVIILMIIMAAVVCMCHWVKRRRKILNDNHSMPAVNDNAEQRVVAPTVYRRQTTAIQNEINAEPEVLRIALIPHGHNRAQQGNGFTEIINRENQSAAMPNEANLQRIRNEPIVMERNESYGQLETATDHDSDADYYFMYDYPNNVY